MHSDILLLEYWFSNRPIIHTVLDFFYNDTRNCNTLLKSRLYFAKPKKIEAVKT